MDVFFFKNFRFYAPSDILLIMKDLKRVFRSLFVELKWYEIAFLMAGFASTIALTIIFKSGILDCFTSLFTILWCFLLAKGKVFGHIVGIIATLLYIIVSIQVAYYGEVLLSAAITIPMSIWAFVEWFKNKRMDKSQGEVVVIKAVRAKELLILLASQIALFPALYFLLKAFGTEFLAVSTLSVSANIIATYLLIRRSDLNWCVWVANSLITLSLWMYLTIVKDISYITLAIMSLFLFVNNIYGFINWQRLKKSQGEKKQVLENIK